ncbi:hypothetical protein BCS96_04315 [Vibrio breoganii]|uniref:hypothetical protein n=1 Tax=Vibrio breoganii TaxID=553239 RepID=UPI000C843449|nr:hypothetical protein [Vibrio breoganii]PMG34860.1 hypothetical protein BCU93_18110 [Vibrio breoganii]PMG82094.1 hypothetical protein BCU81_16790 [Vibrio breoganii]PML82635.1 hypothetical protein BCT68_12040 [Vibrio breoganii]PMM50203.1 hypothetical protein BCT52_02780 [Vibrio breoganii]PMP01159.1 hypothetical protein BCS96_04315 [Vibrio breoganii]
MNRNTFKQIMTTMASYNKKGIKYRGKQLKRLVSMLDDIFQHEPNTGEHLERIGRKQITGYWRRTEEESPQVRQEKYAILKLFFETAQLKGQVPKPKNTNTKKHEDKPNEKE